MSLTVSALLVLTMRHRCAPHCARQIGCGGEARRGWVDSTREPSGDLLQEPFVAVWIAERGVREVTGPRRMSAADCRLSWTVTVEHFAHVHTRRNELSARSLDIRHDEVNVSCRARHGRGQADAEMDRARRAWRRELDASKRGAN